MAFLGADGYARVAREATCLRNREEPVPIVVPPNVMEAIMKVLRVVGDVVRRQAIQADDVAAWLVKVASAHKEVRPVTACLVPSAWA